MSEPGNKRLLVVSGMSGAGKTVALRGLEDAGFYCIDNLPVGFLGAFAARVREGGVPSYRLVAVGIDARNPAEDLARFPEVLAGLGAGDLEVELLFFDASDDVLLKRFSETRRKHPLSRPGVSLAEAIAEERTLLEPIAEAADLHVDTSTTHIHQLRDLIRARIADRPVTALSLQFVSFGFKYGVPHDADFVFDVRCLPNPHWKARLRDRTGLDQEVADFLEQVPIVGEMVDDITVYLARWIPRFEADDSVYLTVAIGCTGGRHRSVYVAEQLARRAQRDGRQVLVSHREM